MALQHDEDPTDPPPRRVVWCGEPPTRCDVTGEPIVGQFIDGRVRHAGQWAIMSPRTHARFGCGLGTGRGQRYKLQPDGVWLKVEG